MNLYRMQRASWCDADYGLHTPFLQLYPSVIRATLSIFLMYLCWPSAPKRTSSLTHTSTPLLSTSLRLYSVDTIPYVDRGTILSSIGPKGQETPSVGPRARYRSGAWLNEGHVSAEHDVVRGIARTGQAVPAQLKDVCWVWDVGHCKQSEAARCVPDIV